MSATRDAGLAGEIERLRNNGEYTYDDMAIFYRTNAQSVMGHTPARRSPL